MNKSNLILFLIVFCLACKETPIKEKSEQLSEPVKEVLTKEKPSQIAAAKEETIKPSIQNTSNKYPWQKDYKVATALKYNIPVPFGFQRTKSNEASFGNWLQYLPLKASNAQVHLYNGALKSNQNVHSRIIDIDTGKRDLQQCADAIMRLKSEYHFSQSNFDAIHFNFTSGDKVSFDDWRKGKKPVIKGNKVAFTPIGNTTDNSYQNFKKYLIQIFNYAGTASLSKEMKSISIAEMQIGDVFIKGGFPGHAVMVIDMAQNSKGEKVFLLSQSYMPAQDIHILQNYNDSNLSPWYPLNFGETLDTPEWSFTKNDLKRF